ncbi:Rieske (2Fe-2S) domain-containing protein [Caballeronia fortuita]|uniref:Rieske (2Fe-2S) domain-containing protein n=1 Tax=Caballeronia fortuita TaxID=1777138 RepID=A0A158A928_9BURK|nr:Rieske 2Fe-2S domain-containing protein [Caballeronia fortuita]SAK54362.1 Rieske (2Fe-2S) domain-containing protein [Caballeronia fortuita]
MLSAAMNERLTRVGPGTPGGELMRRYWIPIAPYSQLDAENPVHKVRVLGEDLVLYKDKSGTLGLIGDRCLHRNVDLRFGIPDSCGLRCPYHGWLFNEDGKCVERPMEATPRGEIKQKLKAYPAQELGGLVFAYLGPLPAPALPRWDLFVWPNAIRQIAIMKIDCNWLQCHENTGDPTHSAWAHGHMFQYVLEKQGRYEDAAARAEHTLHTRLKTGIGIKELYANQSTHGISKGVRYSKELGAEEDYTREHSTVIFPFFTQTGKTGAPRSEYQIRVPIDDEHTYHICYQVYAAPPGVDAPKQDSVPWYEPPRYDEHGKPILDYVLAQDALVWDAQGAITDRSKELLGRTDIPIVLLRKQLDEQIRRVEEGLEPINFWRDASPDIIYGSGEAPDFSKPLLKHNFRKLYHRGFFNDDADRYGPIIEDVKDLHRRIEEAEIAAREASPSTT